MHITINKAHPSCLQWGEFLKQRPMKTFIEEIQDFLIEEFEKRGVIVYYQIEETHPEIAKLHNKMRVFPKRLTKKDIKTMLNWLEIDTIELKNVKIKWKI